MIKRVLFRLVATFLYLVSLLPFCVLYFISDILYFFLYYLTRYRRAVVEDNLLKAFPEKSVAERNTIEKKYFKFLADMIVESIKMLSISEKEIKKRFRFNNIEEITQHFDAGRSVLGVMGHYGNWEWGTHITSLLLSQKVLVIYKPLTNKNFERLFNKMRMRFGAIMVSMKLALRKIIAYKNEPYLAVFVSDQTPSIVDSHQFMPFLNQPTAVFLGIEKIAKLTNNSIIFCYFNCYKRGYYEAVCETLTINPKSEPDLEITKMHIKALENVIKSKPELWLWSHKRWKFKPED